MIGPYSVEEIAQILSMADLRSKAAVLIMFSTGCRIDALRELRFGDLSKVSEFNLYRIWMYNRYRKHRYLTFCTPECAAAIDLYRDYRRKFGEKILDKSPVIRERFDIMNPFTAQAPRFLSRRTMTSLFEDALKRASVNQIKPGRKVREVMTSQGFRKAFLTTCDKANMNYSVREMLAGHRLRNMDPHYIYRTEEDVLAEYVKVIPLLTIDPTQRLEQENQELKKNQNDYLAELGDLRQEFNQMKHLLVHLSKESRKEFVDECLQNAGDRADIEWSCD